MNASSPAPSDFTLHPQLAADTIEVARWDCCRVLLMNDASYPWLILVPQRTGLRDLHQLAPDDLALVTAEVVRASRALETLFQPDKINIAAIGNMVPQLHIHVVARYETDAAWPRPVWGVAPAVPYAEAALAERIAALRGAFGG